MGMNYPNKKWPKQNNQVINYPIYPDCKDTHSFRSGKDYEKFVRKILKDKVNILLDIYESSQDQIAIGESKQGFEIKLDRRISDTGNLSIEIAEKSKASNLRFIPSGIARGDNTWLYLQGNYDVLFIFSKKRLIQIAHEFTLDILPTIQRFLMPIERAKTEAIKVIILTDKGREILTPP